MNNRDSDEDQIENLDEENEMFIANMANPEEDTFGQFFSNPGSNISNKNLHQDPKAYFSSGMSENSILN